MAFMPAIGQGPREESNLSPAIAGHEALQQIARKPTGRAVVDTDIGHARHMMDIGRQSDNFYSAIREALGGLTNIRMVNANKADTMNIGSSVIS